MNLCKELGVDELSNLFAVGPVLMENNNNMNTPLASWINNIWYPGWESLLFHTDPDPARKILTQTDQIIFWLNLFLKVFPSLVGGFLLTLKNMFFEINVSTILSFN